MAIAAFIVAFAGTVAAAKAAPSFTPAAAQEADAARENQVVDGAVMAAEQPMRLAGVLVVLEGPGEAGPVRREYLTGRDGRFLFGSVPPGEYRITASALGRHADTLEVTVAGRPVHVDFALNVEAVSLDELVVTGTVRPTELRELPSPVSIIDRSDIERLAPRNVAEVIRSAVPGAVYADGGPGARRGSFSVRGISSLAAETTFQSTIKIYVDGTEVADPGFITNLDPGIIERIEVLSGPQASTIYGSRAIGGVMQIFTRRGSGGDWMSPRLSGAAELELVESPHVLGNPRAPKYRLSLAGGDVHFGYNIGFSGREEPVWVDLLAMTDQSFFASVDFTLLDRLQVALSTRFQDGYNETSWNPALRRIYTSAGLPDRPPDRRFFTTDFETHSLRVTLEAASWWSHEFRAGIDGHRDFSHDAVPGANSMYTVRLRDTDRWTLAYNTTLRRALASGVDGTVVLGIDHGEYRAVGHDDAEVPDWRDYDAPPAGVDVTQHTDGYFGQAQLGFPGGIHFTGGLRGDIHPGRSDTPLTWSPRVGLTVVRDLGGFTIKPRIAWGQAVLIPDNQQVAGRETPRLVVKPNPGLRAERQRGYDAGVDIIYPGKGSVGVTFFDQDPIDMIDLLLTSEVDFSGQRPRPVLQYQNISRANNRGWEVKIEAQPMSALALNINYGRTTTTIGELGPDYTGVYRSGETLEQRPPWTATVGASLTPREGTSLNVDLTHLAAWREGDFVAFIGDFITGRADPVNKPYPRAYLIDYPAVTKLNMSFSQSLPGGASAFVHVYNLTNTDRFERINLILPRPRTWTFGIRY